MRIIGGQARGRAIKAPKSRQVRPTTDRVREAVFSIIQSRRTIGQAKVLDLFAGSGALGLEALSRGAKSAIFVDQNSNAIQTIHKNARQLAFEERCQTLRLPAVAALKQLARQESHFDLVFVDPPYSIDPAPVLAAIDRLKLLEGTGLLVLEHDPKRSIVNRIGCLQQVTARSYGDTALAIFKPLQEADTDYQPEQNHDG